MFRNLAIAIVSVWAVFDHDLRFHPPRDAIPCAALTLRQRGLCAYRLHTRREQIDRRQRRDECGDAAEGENAQPGQLHHPLPGSHLGRSNASDPAIAHLLDHDAIKWKRIMISFFHFSGSCSNRRMKRPPRGGLFCWRILRGERGRSRCLQPCRASGIFSEVSRARPNRAVHCATDSNKASKISRARSSSCWVVGGHPGR
jgi:hypothetical protein